MDGLLKGKTALITAGARGIGAACAQLFVSQGATVAVADIDEVNGEALVRSMHATNTDCVFLKADLTDAQETKTLCEAFLSRFGAPNIWLNAAGVCHEGYVDELPDDALQQMVSLNMLAAFRVMKGLAPSMMAKGSGSIIQIGSDYALSGMAGMSGYAATKGALYAMTDAFAAEYAPYGIRANSILPGMNFSSMGDSVIAEAGDEEAARIFRSTQMLQRRGEPTDIANAALFLASDMSVLLNAEGLMVDAGQTIIAHKQHFFQHRKGALEQ